MFNIANEFSQSLSSAVHRLDEDVRSFILSIAKDEDSDEEKDGEYSGYKKVARSAFASPSALAKRLRKRGGAISDSCSRSGSTSRRIKDQYRSDPNAAKILQEISTMTAVRPGKQSLSLQENESPELDEEEHATFFEEESNDNQCTEHSLHSDETTMQSNKVTDDAQ